MAKTPEIDLRQDYQRNYIINGNFDFWQRGTGPISVSGAANPTYAADRFFIAGNGASAVEMNRSTDIPTEAESKFQSNYSLFVDVTTADASPTSGDRRWMGYRVEGTDMQGLLGKNISVSFWVKATKAGINSLAFRNQSTDRSYVAEYTINSPNTWENKVITIPFVNSGSWDVDNTLGLEIAWPLMPDAALETSTIGEWQSGNFLASSNQVNHMDSTANEFRIAQVQLIEGSEDLPFRRAGRNIGEEFSMCQRYFQKVVGRWYGVAPNTGRTRNNVTYATQMRAIPTATKDAALSTNSTRYPAGNSEVANIDESSVMTRWIPNSTGGNDGWSLFLDLEAEL